MSINECNRLLENYYKNGDMQKSFFDFVYTKIARDTKNRFVSKEGDSIDIVPFESSPVKVIPLNKKIDISRLDIEEEIKRAKNLILGNDIIKQVYFVYPKNDNFKKHISIKIKELEELDEEYAIKVIPYSLESLARKKGSCNCSEKY